MAELDIRTLHDDDLEQVANLRMLAFGGPRRPLDPETMAVPAERGVGAFRGDRLVGTTFTNDFGQWFGGQVVPCGGVAGVTVAPDQRGYGVARALLAESLDRMRARGEVISALYPTTASLYRSLGYEITGWWTRKAVAGTDLPRPSGTTSWEPVDHADDRIRPVYESCARSRTGWVVPSEGWWRASAHQRGTGDPPSWTWLGLRSGEPVAAVSYSYTGSERSLFDLEEGLVAGVDAIGVGDALAFLGANGTTADRVRTTLPAEMLARHLPEPSRTTTVHDWPWMLRIVDLPNAIAARGWPDGVELEAHLRIAAPHHGPGHDPSGRWVLQVRDGKATVEPGGTGAVAVDLGALAALYGGADVWALVGAGQLAGADPTTVSALGAAFAGHPSLLWFF